MSLFISDLVEMNDYGYLVFRGRLKDLVIRGGENIYPREIEDLLHNHPKVHNFTSSRQTKYSGQVISFNYLS